MAGSRRRYTIRKAPPKPTEPPCPFCEGAYWRYNGREWYACDRVTQRRHACETEAAKEHRRALEARRRASVAAADERARRERRNGRIVKAILALAVAAVIAVWGYGKATSGHSPQGRSPSYGEVRVPPKATPTAKCGDGTLSYAANHQGACSWHGGVAVWYR
jgi:hypothetical protein